MDELTGQSATQTLALSEATLSRFPSKVGRPRYDRSKLTPGIVHIGLGNFHRAHQAWYLHQLMQQGDALDWAILGAGVRPYDADMREKLKAQDCLTTLIELAPGQSSAEISGPMIDYLPIDADNASLIAAMADPAIRIVALTVTEGGYFIDPATGTLDKSHPDIFHDIAHPEAPRTAFGAMVAALNKRRLAGHAPFTGLSCDNLVGNGDILQRLVVALAKQTDLGLAAWIASEGSFPNSMVDCIVPATGPEEIALAASFGIADLAPVTHENFRQWVIEDRFCAGRPNWDAAGATFTENVHGYEMMKIRILNAGHQILANAGELLGRKTIADCMQDPVLSAFFRKVQVEEILPFVEPVPGVTPQDYLVLIAQRFSNPAIQDTTRRVAFDGSSRHSGFVVPIIREALAANASVEGLALVEALWARMCLGHREDGSTIEANDPNWPALLQAANSAVSRPEAWLEQDAIYGDLVSHGPFLEAFKSWMAALAEQGTEKTLKAYATGSERLKGSGPNETL